MKRKIDFIFDEDEANRKIFRFYPRSSHVHGFGEKCPKTWNDVYKVYYSWAVIHQFKFNKTDAWKSYVVFNEGFDECSELGSIPDVLKILSVGDEISLYALGDGVNWNIIHHKEKTICDGWTVSPHYEFIMWKHYTNQGYKFSLSYDDTARFSKYIDFVEDYMLAHSEPI